MNDDYKIIVCTHKVCSSVRQGNAYLPVMVGNAFHQGDALPLGYVGDDTGDNISQKNHEYSEMTGVYWAWKNLKDIRYIGVAHYRRYFDMDVSRPTIEKILHSHEAIILKPYLLPCTAELDISKMTSPEDLYITVDTLLEMFPQYERAAADYIFRGAQWTACNMHITTWERFDDYCRFIFPLLERIESRLRPYPYIRQRRCLGYLAELLTGVYYYYLEHIEHKNLYKVDLFATDAQYPKKNWFLRQLLPLKKKIGRQLLIGNQILHSPIVYLRLDIIGGLKQDGIILKAMSRSKMFGPNFEKVY